MQVTIGIQVKVITGQDSCCTRKPDAPACHAHYDRIPNSGRSIQIDTKQASVIGSTRQMQVIQDNKQEWLLDGWVPTWVQDS